MKKILSFILGLIIVFSSMANVFIGAWAESSDNLMANTTASDWISGWTGDTGVSVDDGIAVRAAWRSTYTKVTLEPETKYTLSFNFGQVRVGDIRVFAASEITDQSTQLVSSGSAPAPGGTTNLANGTFTGDCPTTPVDGMFYTASESFETSSESEYYIILDCFGFVTTSVILKNFSLVAQEFDSNVLAESVAADWTSSWDGNTGSNENGAIKVRSAWRSAYTKVNLKPDTQYDLSFSLGEVRVTDIRVYAASEITDAATQLMSPGGNGYPTGGTNNLASSSVTTTCPSTPVAGEFYTASERFTTTSETEYYIILDCGAFSTTSILLKNLDLSPYVPNANDDVVDPANWNSTWNLTSAAGTAKITNTTESRNGGTAINVSKSNYRDTFVSLTLEANTTYDLSFNYKGTSAISRFHVIAVNDVDPVKYANKPEHLINTLVSEATTVLTEEQSGMTYDGTTWNSYSTSFTTNDNTEYYIVFENNSSGSGFTASDFSFTTQGTTSNANILSNTSASDWISSWDSAAGKKETVPAVKAAWHSAYTKVTLEPETVYDFSLSTAAVKLIDIRVYAANEITDPQTQLKSSDAWVTGGSNDLATGTFNSSAPLDDFATASNALVASYYTASETFTTGKESEYYIILDCGQYLDDKTDLCKFVRLKNVNLVSTGKAEVEPEPTDPNVLANVSSLDWESTWNLTSNPGTATISKATETCDGGDGIYVSKSNYRDTFVPITLEANAKYDLNFKYKGLSKLYYVKLIARIDIDEAKWGSTTEHVELALKSGAAPVFAEQISGTFDNTLWNDISLSFTTNDNTEYYLVLYHADGSGFTASDFSLVKQEETDIPDDSEPTDSNLLANVSSLAWKSTWDLQYGTNVAKIAPSTETCDGGDGIYVEKTRFHDEFVLLTLSAKTKYDLSFKYKGTAQLATVRVIAVNDMDADKFAANPDHLVNAMKKDTSCALAESISGTFDGATWNTVSATFETDENTEYYLVLEHGDGTDFIAGDFSLIAKGPADVDTDLFDKNDVIKYHNYKDWAISSRGSILSPKEFYKEGDTTAFSVEKMRWRTIYTKVELEAGITYKLSFKYKDSDDTPVSNIMIAEEAGFVLYEGNYQYLVADGYTNYGTSTVVNQSTDKEGWKLATNIFTPEKGGTYYLGINASGNSDNTNVHFGDFSLVRYYDPATDVYGTVSAKMGGSVTNGGTLPYTVGKEITVTATPNDGNTFEGWYNADGNKISESASYTFTVKEAFDITAKFSGANMPYEDWMAENGMDGTFENGAMPGWYAVFESTGEVATWATFNPSNYVAHNGNKSMQIIARHQHSYFNFTDLSKNTDYYLNFYIYCADEDVYDAETNTGFKLNEISLSVGGDTYWAKNNEFSEGGGGWHRVELFFNTGESEDATLCINYYGDANITEKAIYLDDVMFVQYKADGLDNADFEDGKIHWMGNYDIATDGENNAATVNKENKLYQSVAVDAHSLYTVSFRAKGDLLAAASKINKYSTASSDLINSQTYITTDGEWAEYSFDVYTGVNSALNLVFEALSDGVQVDDIKLEKQKDSAGGIVEKIDFETERFTIKNSNTDVYEIYEGGEGDANVHSGSKSLHFKYDATEKDIEYLFEESYLDCQISNQRTYKLTFYYKTEKGNTFKISPDFLGEYAGKISVEQKAENNGWNKVNFYVSSGSAVYFKPLIANIIGKTNSDFYIDDITYTIISAVVLESDVDKLYAEPPVALLYNEGFEEPITNENWGTLPGTMKVLSGDTEFGNKYLRVEDKTFYVLPVEVEAGVLYYFSASLRGTDGYIGLSTTADGKGLFMGVTDKVESYLEPTSTKWQRSGFKFSAPISGTVYLVIDVDDGYLEADNILLYKETYALEEKPNGHDIIVPYDYSATSGKNYIKNGGYNSDGSIAEDGSPSTGDTFPATTIILITLATVTVLLLSGRKNKKEAE